MITTFKNLSDLQKYFHSEKVCREYLAKARWGEQVVCPFCASASKPYVIEGGKRYKCSDKDCRQKFSAISGTIFENTKVSLQKWFIAIYIIDSHKKGISSLQLSRDLGVTQKTAWFINHRVREMLRNNAPELLQGTVQIDTTYVGGKLKNKSNAKRKAQREAIQDGQLKNEDKGMVLGFIQDGKTVLTKAVASDKAHDIIPVMRENVKEGSTIVTDEARMFNLLRDKYEHKTVNHSKSEYVRDGFTTNGIESYFATFKRGYYGTYHYMSKKHLSRYCDEFSFRFNTRTQSESERFHKSIGNAHGRRLKYKTLINK
jgi:hypothetical protein